MLLLVLSVKPLFFRKDLEHSLLDFHVHIGEQLLAFVHSGVDICQLRALGLKCFLQLREPDLIFFVREGLLLLAQNVCIVELLKVPNQPVDLSVMGFLDLRHLVERLRLTLNVAHAGFHGPKPRLLGLNKFIALRGFLVDRLQCVIQKLLDLRELHKLVLLVVCSFESSVFLNLV
jgi:hypothetical protein